MKPGGRIGRYELVEPLGEGGMGAVWSAVLLGPQGFRKPVALKVLRDPGADGESLVQEARLGALLSHPNVVSILELGHAAGQWYVAMELVRGVSLSDLVRRGTLDGSNVLEVALQLCAALHHIHTLEVDGRPHPLVHRDVKPQNVMIDRSGLVKLTDLGIARLLGGEGGAAGTPSFMAPEQALGREDPRSDLFSLGATVFAVAARRLPFGRGDDAVREAVRVESHLADLVFLAPVDAVVPGLGAVIGRCLRRDPADRWPDAAVLASALRSLRTRVRPGPSLDELVAPSTEGVTPPRRPEPPTPARLPTPADVLVGREDLVASAVSELGRAGVVSIVGGPGIGKTRLAREVALRVQAGLTAGAFWCAIGEVATSDAVCANVAAQLGVRVDEDPVDAVGRVLAARGPLLLVLDEAEAAAEVVGALVGAWRTAAPEARFLVTSRRATTLGGGVMLTVGPLSEDAAVRLFRARSPRATDDEALTRAIVARLDFHPLAIALAAGRSATLPLALLLKRLETRLHLLEADSPQTPTRQRSLKAALDASVELLPERARVALGQLSVFVGSFPLEAAEAVVDLSRCPGASWGLEALEVLVDHHLLQVEGLRFRMWSHVREFAKTTVPREEREAALARHGAWYARMGSREAVDASSRVGGRALRMARAQESENLLAACHRAIQRRNVPVATQTALAIWSLTDHGAPYAMARDLLEEVADIAGGSDGEVPLLRALSVAFGRTGNTSEALAAIDRAVALSQGNELEAIRCLGTRAGHLYYAGQMAAARDSLEALAPRARAIGEPQVISWILVNLGVLRRATGAPETAAELYREGLAQARAGGFLAEQAQAEGSLAVIATHEGRLEEATLALGRAAAACKELGRGVLEHHYLANLASIRLLGGPDAEAVASLREGLRFHRLQGDRASTVRLLMALGEALRLHGEVAAAHECWDEAQALGLRTADRRVEGRACLLSARSWLDGGDVERASVLLDEADGLLPPDPPVQDELAGLRACLLATRGQARAAAALLAPRVDRLGAVALADAAVVAALAADVALQDRLGQRLAALPSARPLLWEVARNAGLHRLAVARGFGEAALGFRVQAVEQCRALDLAPRSWLVQRLPWWLGS